MNSIFAKSLLHQLDNVLCEYDTYLALEDNYQTARELQKLISMAKAALARAASFDKTHKESGDEVSAVYDYHEGYKLEILIGIIGSLKVSIENGYIEGITSLIRGEIFDNFLEMAQHLLDEGYKDAAAVIAGSSLENQLRNMCVSAEIETETTNDKGQTRPKKADQMNADLAKIGKYSKLDLKAVTAWLDLRNKAAHGHYEQYTKEQVILLIGGIRNFIARTLNS